MTQRRKLAEYATTGLSAAVLCLLSVLLMSLLAFALLAGSWLVVSAFLQGLQIH